MIQDDKTEFIWYTFHLVKLPHNYPKYICIVFIAICLPVATLVAEVVILKDGTTASGRIIGQTLTSIKLRTFKGNRIIPKKNVSKIQYVPLTQAQIQLQRKFRKKRQAAMNARRLQIQKDKIARDQREQLLEQIQSEEQARKSKDAMERAERAAALRELVKNGQMEKPADEAISFWDFTWRSLLIPGWGHFTLERPWFGYFYMGGTAALLGNVYQTYQVGKAATDENHQQVEQNYLLSLIPGLATREIRIGYSYYANAQAAVVFEQKVQDYHNSLYVLAVFYGVNVVHILYNAIAWENGLLIVDGDEINPATHIWRPQMVIRPDNTTQNLNRNTNAAKPGTAVEFRMTYRF